MTNPFLGEIRAFSFAFPPKGWVACNGQLMSIQQNTALFALLGTIYGGNGVNNFALPDLRGRMAMAYSASDVQGTAVGTEGVQLLAANLPMHNHNINAAQNALTTATNVPGPTVIMGTGTSGQPNDPPVSIYSTAGGNVTLAPLGPTGGSQPHENRMPILVMNYCIALVGIFPSRN